MLKILHPLLHHSELYSEADEEADVIDRMASEGLIHYVNLETASGWAITYKGIQKYRESI